MDARHYFESEKLSDGSDVVVRSLRPEDKKALREGFRRLSTGSVYFRFFRIKRDLSERELIYFTELDFDEHVAIGLEINDSKQYLPIGVGRYVVQNNESALARDEFAITVADAHQELGAGSILLKHLVKIARHQKIDVLVAHVLAQNARMIRVVRDCGMQVRQKTISGVTELSIHLNERFSKSESATDAARQWIASDCWKSVYVNSALNRYFFDYKK